MTLTPLSRLGPLVKSFVSTTRGLVRSADVDTPDGSFVSTSLSNILANLRSLRDSTSTTINVGPNLQDWGSIYNRAHTTDEVVPHQNFGTGFEYRGSATEDHYLGSGLTLGAETTSGANNGFRTISGLNNGYLKVLNVKGDSTLPTTNTILLKDRNDLNVLRYNTEGKIEINYYTPMHNEGVLHENYIRRQASGEGPAHGSTGNSIDRGAIAGPGNESDDTLTVMFRVIEPATGDDVQSRIFRMAIRLATPVGQADVTQNFQVDAEDENFPTTEGSGGSYTYAHEFIGGGKQFYIEKRYRLISGSKWIEFQISKTLPGGSSTNSPTTILGLDDLIFGATQLEDVVLNTAVAASDRWEAFIKEDGSEIVAPFLALQIELIRESNPQTFQVVPVSREANGTVVVDNDRQSERDRLYPFDFSEVKINASYFDDATDTEAGIGIIDNSFESHFTHTTLEQQVIAHYNEKWNMGLNEVRSTQSRGVEQVIDLKGGSTIGQNPIVSYSTEDGLVANGTAVSSGGGGGAGITTTTFPTSTLVRNSRFFGTGITLPSSGFISPLITQIGAFEYAGGLIPVSEILELTVSTLESPVTFTNSIVFYAGSSISFGLGRTASNEILIYTTAIYRPDLSGSITAVTSAMGAAMMSSSPRAPLADVTVTGPQSNAYVRVQLPSGVTLADIEKIDIAIQTGIAGGGGVPVGGHMIISMPVRMLIGTFVYGWSGSPGNDAANNSYIFPMHSRGAAQQALIPVHHDNSPANLEGTATEISFRVIDGNNGVYASFSTTPTIEVWRR